jgi:hypothetical protein
MTLFYLPCTRSPASGRGVQRVECGAMPRRKLLAFARRPVARDCSISSMMRLPITTASATRRCAARSRVADAEADADRHADRGADLGNAPRPRRRRAAGAGHALQRHVVDIAAADAATWRSALGRGRREQEDRIDAAGLERSRRSSRTPRAGSRPPARRRRRLLRGGGEALDCPSPRSGWRSPSARPAYRRRRRGRRAPWPSTWRRLMPCASARSEARWMVGPSAIGSENGTPSSMMSAPPSTSACISGSVSAAPGSPAVMKGISALRPRRPQALKTVWIRHVRSHCEAASAARDIQVQNWMPERSATVCMSLSPRPERLTSRILSFGSVGASLARRRARALDSSAGMMPSSGTGRGRPRAPRRR